MRLYLRTAAALGEIGDGLLSGGFARLNLVDDIRRAGGMGQPGGGALMLQDIRVAGDGGAPALHVDLELVDGNFGCSKPLHECPFRSGCRKVPRGSPIRAS